MLRIYVKNIFISSDIQSIYILTLPENKSKGYLTRREKFVNGKVEIRLMGCCRNFSWFTKRQTNHEKFLQIYKYSYKSTNILSYSSAQEKQSVNLTLISGYHLPTTKLLPEIRYYMYIFCTWGTKRHLLSIVLTDLQQKQ